MEAYELIPNGSFAGGKGLPETDESEEPPASLPMLKKALTPVLQYHTSNRSLEFLHQHFPQATQKDWNSWQWQLKNSFTSMATLSRVLDLKENEIRPRPGYNDILPLRITPYYASLMDPQDSTQPLRRSMVPVLDEFAVSPGEASDPLAEGHDSVVPNLVHRYPDRVLFLVTGFCASYCRYCTRSHMVASQKCHHGLDTWLPALQYIKEHNEIRDVLISGGDVLTMTDKHISFLLASLRSIPHVEIVRLGTKVPMVLPQRITPGLVSLLKRFHPLFISIHATHPEELTPESSQALQRLADAGIPLGSQTVLLKGINDDVPTMKTLMHGLLKNRVRPYYLYQCDPILGSAHFRTPVSKGLEIIEGLRGHTSGYAVPHFVIDAPGGGGKIPLLPDYYQGRENGSIRLRNYEGKVFHYPDMESRD
ncbi:MAG: KamA family radical SAM protein [Bacteroidota bacterium]